MKNLNKFAALALAVMGVTAAQAGTDTANMNVRVTITATCDIHSVSPADVNFGSILSSATDADAVGTLNVNCTQGTDYRIGLDDGQNASGGSRRMVKGSDSVAYDLYLDAARSNRWGGGTSDSAAGTGSGSSQAISVYGRIATANSPAGNYSDVVVATVTY